MMLYLWFMLLWGAFFVKGAPSASSGDSLNPNSLIHLDLVKHINAFITLESFTTNLIRRVYTCSVLLRLESYICSTELLVYSSINFDVNNPLPLVPLTIQRIKSDAGVNGETFATFDHTFSPVFTIEPLQTANSGIISNVNLTQGALASLGIIPLGALDIDSNVTLLEILPIPIDGLQQSGVPTTYILSLS